MNNLLIPSVVEWRFGLSAMKVGSLLILTCLSHLFCFAYLVNSQTLRELLSETNDIVDNLIEE